MTIPRILICYSNPIDTSRLRLDVEHNLIDAVVKQAGFDPAIVKRIHASTFEDLVTELAGGSYEILQFSGHGDDNGIYLENPAHSSSDFLDAQTIRHVLEVCPTTLRVLILTCCFSNEYSNSVSPLVPYLISISGPLPDKAAVLFSKIFFRSILQGLPIEVAFKWAESFARREGLRAQITRRGLLKQEGKLIVEAAVERSYKIVLDLTAIRSYISQLSISEDRFLDAICNSLQAHLSLFLTPMERIAIPFGEFIGIFSWKNEIDPIVCHQVFQVNTEISDEVFEQVIYLMSRYTAIARARYRSQLERQHIAKPEMIRLAINKFHETESKYFDNDDSLRKLAPIPYKIAKGVIRVNLTEADRSWAQEDYSQSIIHLETALTTFHNFILQIIKSIEP